MVKDRINHKSIMKLLLYFSLLIFVVTTSEFTTTQSKYKKEESNAIIYKNKLYKIYKGEMNLMYSATYTTNDEVVVVFSLAPNSEIGTVDRETDYYTIEKPKSCRTVIADASKGNVLSNDGDTYTINGDVIMRLYCDRKEPSIQYGSDDQYRIAVKVYEQIKNEDQFIYTDGTIIFSSPVIVEPEPEKPTETLKVSGSTDDVYKKLEEWMRNYVDAYWKPVKLSTTTEKLKEYLFGNGNDIPAGYITPDILNGSIKGLKVEKSGNSYTFTIEENLFGYVLMDKTFKSFLYYTTKDENTIYEATEYYLEKYVYPDQSVEIRQAIMNYLRKNNFANAVINGSGKITGLFINNSEQIGITKNTLLEAAKGDAGITGDPGIGNDGPGIEEPPIDDPVDDPEPPVDEPEQPEIPDYIPFGGIGQMQSSFSAYMSNIRGIHPEYDNISDSALSTVSNDELVLSSITKNNTDSETIPGPFRDYFIEYDEEFDNYLGVMVSSNGTDYNSLELKALSLNRSMVSSLIFTNNEDNSLGISFVIPGVIPSEPPLEPEGEDEPIGNDPEEDVLSEEEKTKISEVLLVLDTYLDTSTTEYTFTRLEDGSISVNYTSNK